MDTIKWHQKLFIFTLYLSWILYVLSLFFAAKYDLEIYSFIANQILKIYIGAVLAYKFNPWTGHLNKFSKFDKRLAWHAGTFLLVSTVITTIVRSIIKKTEYHLLTIDKLFK